MSKKISKLEELYNMAKVDLVDITVENLVISDERLKIKYDVAYQRRYVWDIKKSVNLIETIFLHGIIPPLIVIQIGEKMEIIDR